MDPWVLLEPLRDRDGRIVDFVHADANPAACAYCDMTHDELVGSRLLDLLPGHRPSHLFDAYVRTLESGEPLVLDGVHHGAERLDGEERCYDIRAVPVDGLLSYTWRDVTAAQRAVGRLAASEEHYRLLAEHATDVVYRLDAAGCITWVSPSVIALGLQPEQVVGRHIRDLLHPDDLAREGARRAGIRRAGGTGGRAELRVATGDGGWRWMSLAGAAVLDDGGAVIGAVESLRDIDAEVAARHRLAESERLSRLVSENTSDVVLVAEPDRTIRWVAPSVLRALGWQPADLVGTDLAALVPAEEREQHQRLWSGLSDGSVRRGDFTTRLRVRDGGHRWFTGRASTVVGPATGDVLGVAVGMRDVTTEKQAAQQAREALRAEELTRFSMDAAAIGMALLTLEHSIRHANPAFTDMLGRSPDELEGHALLDLTHPDDVGATDDGLRRLVAGEIPVLRQRVRFRHPDGAVVWGDLAVSPVHDAAGRLEHLVAQVVDVTAEMAALDRLRVESERFRLLAETATDVVYRTGPDGLIEWISPSVQGVLGWDPQLLIGTPGIALVDPVDEDTATQDGAALYRHGRAIRTAVRFRTATGGSRLMAVSARPVVDEDGRVVGGAVGLRDVTEAHQARLALSRSERHFRLAMAAAPEGMAISEVDGTFRQVNPALARMLRRTPDELQGRSLADFAAPDAVAGIAAARRDLLAGGVGTIHRLVRLDVDGTELWAELAVSLLEGTDAGAPFLIEQLSDRTAATRLQRDLEFQARHDLLTGLSNRADLLSRLRERFVPVSDQGPPAADVGVLYADVDEFKAINDRFGHAVGDEVLAVVADRLRACVRLDDVVGRVGGDEFVVVLGGLDDVAELEHVAAKVHDAASLPAEVAGVTVPITISVGATLGRPDADPDRVLAAADRALYRAKAAGRDRVVVDTGGAATRARPGT